MNRLELVVLIVYPAICFRPAQGRRALFRGMFTWKELVGAHARDT